MCDPEIGATNVNNSLRSTKPSILTINSEEIKDFDSNNSLCVSKKFCIEDECCMSSLYSTDSSIPVIQTSKNKRNALSKCSRDR